MITAIEIENFKAVGERQRIELRPITLLFGPNSGGKSTVLHALHYARELFLRGRADVHRTESGGEFIDLGGLRRLVHGRRWSERVAVKIDIDLDADDLAEFPVERELTELLAFDQDEITSRIKRASVELTIGEFSTDPHIIRYAVGINGEPLATIYSGSQDQFVKLRDIHWHHPIFLSDEDRTFAELARNAEAMRRAAEDAGHPAAGQADALKQEAEQEIRGALVELFEQAGETPTEATELQVAAPAGHRHRRALPLWDRPLDIYFPSGELSLPEPVAPGKPDDPTNGSRRTEMTNRLAARAAFTELVSKLVVGVGQRIRDELEVFRYLGPLRVIPPRHRDVVDPIGPSRWPNGLAAWDLLNEWGDELRKEVSRWIWSDDLFATGYQIDRFEYREISASLQHRMLEAVPVDDDASGTDYEQVSLEVDDLTEHCKVMLLDLTRGLRLDPHDVGVGISQVVPVVVAVLAPGSSLVAVEQPELHVHPRLQVVMGDLLIAAATGKTSASAEHRRLLIETHSEHLLLRLLRRIRETAEQALPAGTHPLTTADLAVYYVQPGKDGAAIGELRVNATGEFIDPWPQGFFEERGEELFG